MDEWEWDSPNHKHVDATYLLLYRRQKTGWSTMGGSKGNSIMTGNLTINITLVTVGSCMVGTVFITVITQLAEIIVGRKLLQSL